jgi:hypothetical protein
MDEAGIDIQVIFTERHLREADRSRSPRDRGAGQ